MQKQITVIGATAGVGLLCVTQALAKGHKVVSMSRHKSSLSGEPNLVTIEGSSAVTEDVKKAIANSDALLVTVGNGNSLKKTTLFTDTAFALIEAQRETETKIPFIILTGFGAGNSSEYQGFFVKIIMKILIGSIYRNKSQMEEMIAESAIHWEFVRPGILTDGEFTGKYQAITAYSDKMNISKISRADVADFMVKQAENATDLGKYPALSY